jgi:hypothetical protein
MTDAYDWKYNEERDHSITVGDEKAVPAHVLAKKYRVSVERIRQVRRLKKKKEKDLAAHAAVNRIRAICEDGERSGADRLDEIYRIVTGEG